MTYALRALVLSFPLTDDVFDQLNTSENKQWLYLNKNLTEHQWDGLWEKNLPVGPASHLADCVHTQEQVDRVLSQEKRGSVLVGLFHGPHLTEDQQAKVFLTARGSSYVYSALRSKFFYRENLEIAARHFRGSERLEWCAVVDQTVVSDDDALKALVDCDSLQGRRHIRDVSAFNMRVHKLFEARPQLVDALFALDVLPEILSVQLASSRFIAPRVYQERLAADHMGMFSYEACAFIANPVVHVDLIERFKDHQDDAVRKAVHNRLTFHNDTITVPYDQVSDDSQIEWLVNRILPSKHRPDGKPCEMVALGRNENIQVGLADRLYKTLLNTSVRTVPVSELNKTLDQLESRLGLPCSQRKAETGFWDDMVGHPPYWWLSRDTEYLLDPQARPWTDEQINEAYAKIPADTVQLFETEKPIQWWHTEGQVHAYCAYHLGNDPVRWELLANLAENHTGTLSQLVMAAKRLAVLQSK
jgi:hypothetical protein